MVNRIRHDLFADMQQKLALARRAESREKNRGTGNDVGQVAKKGSQTDPILLLTSHLDDKIDGKSNREQAVPVVACLVAQCSTQRHPAPLRIWRDLEW